MPDQLHMNTAKMMSFHNNPPAPLFTQIYRKLKKFKADSRQRKKRMVIDNRWIQSKVLPSTQHEIISYIGVKWNLDWRYIRWVFMSNWCRITWWSGPISSWAPSPITLITWQNGWAMDGARQAPSPHQTLEIRGLGNSFAMKSWKSLLIINWLFVSILYVYSK